MKNLKRAYTFAFCVIYKKIDKLKFAFWSDWKTILVMSMAELFFIAGIAFLYDAITHGEIVGEWFGSSKLILSSLIVLFKAPIFIINDRWKIYMTEFDDLPQTERKKWTAGTWIIVALIIVFLVISVYCYSLVDWQGRNNIPIRKV